MSGFGIHAGLALAGVVAGLPVAAVVQWRREPPSEVWYVSGADGDRSEMEPRLRTSPWCYRSPGGSLVTSVGLAGCDVHLGEARHSFLPAPRALRWIAAVEQLPYGAMDHEGFSSTGLAIASHGASWTRVMVVGPR